MLYRLLILGQIPGTSIDLSFNQLMILYVLLATYIWLRHNHPAWRLKLQARAGSFYHLVGRELQFIRRVKLIARKG